MAERQFGPYRLVRQIAVGGMAEIHLAKTKGIAGFEKYVALKMIHPNFAEDEQFIDMLVDEAKIAVQLNHGNIAQTFDLGRVGDTFYITMEYVDGADLYKILRRGSEMDFELPLDVCAFVAKEIASALDHAHRKRDHTGKTLGIVHRDVSPQNVLISYSGEVKLVDFGIAKATMKARQTAVGVIKGKYYYMSPEQAWGDQIDHRSDIFSAGIVLYEMITGQMLYLEEDLHKLLDMARKADIAPPSTLRKGIPPQLERIVMHALERDRRTRYQNAADFATDLERFLHTYSPVFTASKVAQIIKQVIGEPVAVPNGDVELRDGPMATHTLTSDDLILDKDELRDSNSVIFRVEELQEKEPKKSAGAPEGRITRQAEISDALRAPTAPLRPSAGAKPATAPRAPSKPRAANEETRQVANPAPPPGASEDSGLLELKTPPPPEATWKKHDADSTMPEGPDLENVAESTMITGQPGFGGFMMDVASEEGADATVVSSGPPTAPAAAAADDDDDEDGETLMGARPDADEDGATVTRDFRDAAKPKVAAKRGPAPPALAAKIHAPAVSEIRKPRASRKTPQGGVPAAQPNVLQAIVGAQPAEPMPAPRPPPARAESPPQRTEDSGALTIPQQPSPVAGLGIGAQPVGAMGQAGMGHPGPMPSAMGPAYNGYAADASGLPMTPPQGVPAGQPYGQYPQYPGYPQQPGYPPVTGFVSGAQPPGAHPTGFVSGAQPPGAHPPGFVSGAQPPGAHPTGFVSGAQPPGAHPTGFVSGAQPPYPQQTGFGSQGYPQQGYSPHGYQPAPVTPGALYQLQPQGASTPQPMTLTGQLRLFEADEIPDKYKVSGGPKWIKLVIAGVIAISVAAGVTFFIIKSTRDTPPEVGSIRVESVPAGAEVTFDGTRLAGSTPLTVDSVPTGTRHEIKVELARHKDHIETVDIPKRGGEVVVKAVLTPISGKLRVVTQPDGAEIWIDGQLRGRAPTTISDIDMSSAKQLELRMKDYQPYVQALQWPANGEINVNQKLQR